MSRRKLFFIIQTALIVLWVILMSIAAIRLYVSGAAYQAQGHPEAWIYTREKAVSVIAAYAPILLAAVAMTIAGSVMGIRDTGLDKPVKDPMITDLFKARREARRDPEAEARQIRQRRCARLILLAAAVIFVIAGIFNGSMQDVLIKAANLCTECVGLG